MRDVFEQMYQTFPAKLRGYYVRLLQVGTICAPNSFTIHPFTFHFIMSQTAGCNTAEPTTYMLYRMQQRAMEDEEDLYRVDPIQQQRAMMADLYPIDEALHRVVHRVVVPPMHREERVARLGAQLKLSATLFIDVVIAAAQIVLLDPILTLAAIVILWVSYVADRAQTVYFTSGFNDMATFVMDMTTALAAVVIVVVTVWYVLTKSTTL